MKSAKRKLVIFGTAQRAAEYFKIISRLPDFEVVGFADNNPQVIGDYYFDTLIYSPDQLKNLGENVEIIVASSSYPSIIHQLRSIGIDRRRIYASLDEMIENLSDKDVNKLKTDLGSELKFVNLDRVSNYYINKAQNRKYLLIVSGGYPKGNVPRGNFVHSRVRQYREQNIELDIFGYIENASYDMYEYDKLVVHEGGNLELLRFLENANYEKILIHFLTEKLAFILEEAGYADKEMIVWCHGFEVLPWYRCWFNFSKEEIECKDRKVDALDLEKKEFLQKWFRKENIQWVFVSDWLKLRAKKWLGLLPKKSTTIHNYIEEEFYNILLPREEDRLHIFSVKNHKTRMYANDLTAKAILELSRKDFFEKLTFELYGDGELFEKNFGELQKRNFSNVHIYRRFLNHKEMIELCGKNGIFLSPTRMDSHQVTCAEMMAAGRYVITSNIGPMQEVYDDRCVSFFEAENYFLFAEEIEYIYYHPVEFVEKCKNARERIRLQCGYENTIAREIDLMKS